MSEKNLEAVIDLAITKEEESFNFYTGLQTKVNDQGARDTLGFLAKEEVKHKEFLVRYRQGNLGPDTLRLSHVVDYRIAEHLEPPELKATLEGKDAYLLAAHRELRAYNFYKALAAIHPEGTIKQMLDRMANEELKHKEKVEYLYTNAAFPQTDGG
ncbi:MAG TPA: ferritin family protein [Syntrophorhabdales bacterium]|nr:ferritin family protein [Syntrophorhabdales bacterium]